MDICSQEKRIQSIERDVGEIKRNVNGAKGLMAIVIKQAQITTEQGSSIDKLMVMVDILRVKDIETDKEKEVKIRLHKENERLKQEKRVQQKWFIGTLFTIVGLVLTGVMVYAMLQK